MREIKFRAWDNVQNKYCFGVGDNGDMIVMHFDGRVESSDPETYKADDFIIEQYTGLKDKNGIEIYEGDIIKCSLMFNGSVLPHIGKIVYLNEHCSFATKNEGCETLFSRHYGIREIIGNIHQSPGLSS